jgi:hypothetical protein
MRAIPALALTLVIATAALGSPAGAQTGNGPPQPSAPTNAATTTGQAPSAPAPGPAPNGHRQPTAAQVPNEAPSVTPFDRDVDRNLQICRGC